MYSIIPDRRVYFDGGLGTLLQGMGLEGGKRPELWNTENPACVKRAHEMYLEAGAEIIAANTFGAAREHLGDKAGEAMREGARLARAAVDEAGRGHVAIDMGSLGRLLEPYGDMPFEDAVSQYRDAFICGLEAGGELALIETMTDQLEIKAAVLGVREAMEKSGIRVPLLCSMSPDINGRLLTGATIEGVAAMLAALRVDAIGINCGLEPRAQLENARRLIAASPLPVYIQPNASLPVEVDGRTVFKVDPEDFAAQMRDIAALGAWGLGGCCGTTPAHIKALIAATRELEPRLPEKRRALTLSGRGACLTFGERPVVVGERLNPTGKPVLKRALREGDTGALLREAVAQAEAGAQALDVNVGIPEIDEAETLPRVVTAVQGVCELPLMLDSSDPAALEAALRVYNGRPIINSVSGKRESLDAVLPLAARYGGALVALTLDEDGVPPTAGGRLKIAARILAEAAKYGISKDDLLFDALAMTVAADKDAARITLDALRGLKDMGLKTVLGVSNASHGLPQRPVLNAAFIALAVESGLDAAIMNPSDRLCRAMLDASSAVCGRDAGFERFIGEYADAGKLGLYAAGEAESGARASAAGERGSGGAASDGNAGEGATGFTRLASSVLKGLMSDAGAISTALLEGGAEPLAVIEQGVMPALREAGERFEAGTLFLPQLLGCAAAAQAAFEKVRERMPARAADGGRVVVLATVKGDVHDIGKNIVKVMLQNYGFDVVDLGRDVPPDAVLAAARERGARLVGLSALMTTTVPAMRETIALLRLELPAVKVMVGGAVLTEEYAAQIGADYYAKDAMGAVRVAEGAFA